jgi:hypothetical protein
VRKAYFPSVHILQVERPGFSLKNPTGQLKHVVLPVRSIYLPDVQFEHSIALMIFEKVPFSHETHSPEFKRYPPGEHPLDIFQRSFK